MKKTLLLAFWILSIHITFAQVKYTGAMSEMGKSGFVPTISLDSLEKYKGLLALGPLGKMQGEITVLEGKVYTGVTNPDGSTEVKGDWSVQAPFLVYSEVSDWENFPFEGYTESIIELEKLIVQAAESAGVDLNEPFFFRIQGVFPKMTTHIVTPRSPEIPGYVEGQNQKNFEHVQEAGELIGVYSKVGKRIYTHHDSEVHIHFLNGKKDFSGHLDKFSGELKRLNLLLPKDRVKENR